MSRLTQLLFSLTFLWSAIICRSLDKLRSGVIKTCSLFLYPFSFDKLTFDGECELFGDVIRTSIVNFVALTMSPLYSRSIETTISEYQSYVTYRKRSGLIAINVFINLRC